MARTVHNNFDIQKMVCIDVEKEMLERAESFCYNEKVEFLQCDVRQLPYQEMFDIVTAVQVNHYFKRDERMAAIKKCYDALAENGIYFSFDNFATMTSVNHPCEILLILRVFRLLWSV